MSEHTSEPSRSLASSAGMAASAGAPAASVGKHTLVESASAASAGGGATQLAGAGAPVQRKAAAGAAAPPPPDGDRMQRLFGRRDASAADAARAPIQRSAAGPATSDPDAALAHAAGSTGAPLPAGLGARFGASLGSDLSSVRVHTGAGSAAAAEGLGARAFAVGQDIHFGAGQYRPDDASGAHLLAHEVAHTVQQSRGSGGAPQAKREVSAPGDAAEVEADRAADAMVAGAPAQVGAAGPGGAIHRAAAPTPDQTQKLDSDYQQAVTAADWPRAGELLNGFNRDDILARLGKLSRGLCAAIHVGARDNPKVGPDSQAAQLSRSYFLDINFENESKLGHWDAAAGYLNGYNTDDILAHVRSLSPDQRGQLKSAAGKYDRVVTAIDTVASETAGGATPAAAPAGGGGYTADDAKAVADAWAKSGATSQTATNEPGQTTDFRTWKTHAGEAIAAGVKSKTLTAARGQELRAWVAGFDAHEKWKVNSTGPEPADPGAAPTELPALTYPVGKTTAALGAPPGTTWEKKQQYDVTTIDGSKYSYKDHVDTSYTISDSGVGSAGKTGGQAKIAEVFDKAGVPAPDPATVKKVFSILSSLEGKFDAINTYDTGYISVGFIQFISGKTGAGSLTTLLRDMKAKAPADYNTYFHSVGIDVDDKGFVVVDPSTGTVLHGEAAVKKVIDDKRLAASFQAAGAKSSEFQYAQARTAYAMYYLPDHSFTIALKLKDPSDPKKATTVSGKYSDVLNSEAGKVAIVDRGVQHGTGGGHKSGGAGGKFLDACQAVVDKHSLAAVDIATLAKYEAEIVPMLKNRFNVSDASLTQPPAVPADTKAAPAAPGGAPAAQPKAAGPLDTSAALPAPGGGAPLDPATAGRMGGALGADFSGVRVHQDGSAAQLGARAYARGEDVHFAPGQFAPGTRSGDELIGHELAHVVQQRAGRVAAPQAKDAATGAPTGAPTGAAINDSPELEAEADRLGALAASTTSGDAAAGPASAAGTAAAAAASAAGPIQRSADPAADAGADKTKQLDADYHAALDAGDWSRAAELLNGFQKADILARLAKLGRGACASLHADARDNPRVGPGSQVAQLTRPYFLDINVDNEVNAGHWEAAAGFLDEYGDAELPARVRKLTDDQRNQLKPAAAQHPRVVDAITAAAAPAANDAKPGDGAPPPAEKKGSWTPPKADHFPFESDDPRVIKETTVYKGNPPPPDGWRYWPPGKQILPREKQMADEATKKPAGTFLQDMVNGELVGVRTEWHPYTVLYDKETKQPYQKPGLYRGGSLMVPLEQPKPDPAQTPAQNSAQTPGQPPAAAPTQTVAPGQAAPTSTAPADAGKSSTTGGPGQGVVPTVPPGTAPLKRPNGLQEIIEVFGQPGTNLGMHEMRCGAGGAAQQVYCHNKVAPLLKAVFDNIVNDGKAEHLHYFAGCYNDRNVGGAEKKSAHAWGIAVDINPQGNARVKSDTPEDKIPVSDSQKVIAPYFEAQGFVWGKAFGDAMHFQYCTGY